MGSTRSGAGRGNHKAPKALIVGWYPLVMQGVHDALTEHFEVIVASPRSGEIVDTIAAAAPALLIVERYCVRADEGASPATAQDVMALAADAIRTGLFRCPFIVLMEHPTDADEALARRMRAGALLSLRVSPEVTLETALAVLEGRRFPVAVEVASRRYERMQRHVVADVTVSAREAAMLLYRYGGMTNAEIAGCLGLRPRTIDQYLDYFRRLVAGGDMVLLARWIGDNRPQLEELARK